MRRWSSFVHLFLDKDERLRAVLNMGEGTVTLWVGSEPILTLHHENRPYGRDLASGINIAIAPEDEPPAIEPPPSPVARILRLVRGGA